jgi:hypothetical protein
MVASQGGDGRFRSGKPLAPVAAVAFAWWRRERDVAQCRGGTERPDIKSSGARVSIAICDEVAVDLVEGCLMGEMNDARAIPNEQEILT